LKTQHLKNIWRPLDRTCLKIDRCAQMSPYRNLQAIAVRLQPQLTLLCTQRGDQKVRIKRVNRVDKFILAQLFDRSKSRAGPAHAGQTASLVEPLAGRGSHLLRGSK